jgi:hypothetical protein
LPAESAADTLSALHGERRLLVKRLIGIGILIAIVGVVVGVQEAYVYFTNREPVRMTCAEYLSRRPTAKWVELTDCAVDYVGTIQLTSRIIKSDKGSFVPVRPPGASGRAGILLKMNTDEASRRAMDALSAEMTIETRAGDVAAVPTRTISGLIGSWSDEQSKTRRALENSDEVARDFVILYEGRKPALGIAAALPVVALLGLGMLFFLSRKSRSIVPPAMPSAVPPFRAGPPPLPPRAGRNKGERGG